MPVDPHPVAHGELAVAETHDGHARPFEIVHYGSDELFRHAGLRGGPCQRYHAPSGDAMTG